MVIKVVFKSFVILALLSMQIAMASVSVSVKEVAKLVDVNAAADDEFGRSVAVSGNTAVVGVRYDNCANGDFGCGSVIVFERHSVTGLFEQTARLTALDGKQYDLFGSSVAIDGETIVVGAFADDDENKDVGSIYVFEKPASGHWVSKTENAKLTIPNGTENRYLGGSVSISNDVVVAGAEGDNPNGFQSGAAYVFAKPSFGGWVDSDAGTKLIASEGQITDRFGKSVSISNDTIIVGMYGDGCSKGPFCGSAIIFDRAEQGGSFAERATLTAFDADSEDEFGFSVSISGDTVIIGAPYDGGSGKFFGSAYIYSKPPSGWISDTAKIKLTASDADVDDTFGCVAISGDMAIVGSDYNDDNGTNSGSAYLFQRPAGGWVSSTENVKIVASDADGYDWFGFSVAIDHNLSIVGAPRNRDAGHWSGSSYLFESNATVTGDAYPSIMMYLLD